MDHRATHRETHRLTPPASRQGKLFRSRRGREKWSLSPAASPVKPVNPLKNICRIVLAKSIPERSQAKSRKAAPSSCFSSHFILPKHTISSREHLPPPLVRFVTHCFVKCKYFLLFTLSSRGYASPLTGHLNGYRLRKRP